MLLAAGLLAGGCDRGSPQRGLERARAALAAGDAVGAEKTLKAVLRSAPKTVEARLLLAALHAARQDGASAAKEWQQAIALGAPPERALPGWVAARVLDGDPRGALDTARGAVLADPAARAELAFWRARAHETLGAADAALLAWREALAARPTHAPSRVALLRLAAREGGAASADASAALGAILADPAAPLDAWLLQAEFALARNDTATALAAFSRGVALAPITPEPRLRLASLLIDLDRLDAAREQLTVLESLAPGRPATRHVRALIDLREGRLDAARDGAQTILATDPDFLPAVALAATVALRQGALEQAERLARQLLERAPGSAQGSRLLVQALLGRNEPVRALEVARTVLDRGLRDAALAGLAGEAALRTGDLVGATRWFELATTIDPADPSRRIGLGLALLGAGRVADGLAALAQAAERDPGAIRADLSRVTALLQLRRYDEALAAADRLLAKAPTAAIGHNLRGTALLGRGDVPGARAAFDRALQRDPAFFAAAANQAELDLREGRPERAQARFEAVLRHDPRSVAALGGLARLAERAGRAEEAGSLLRRAHAIDPGALEPTLALAAHLDGLGRAREALPVLAVAAERHGAEPRLLELLARALLGTDQVQQALEVIERRARLGPSSASIQMQLGAVRAAAGDIGGAVVALRSAARLDLAAALDLTPKVLAQIGPARRDDAARLARQLRHQAPEAAVGAALEGDLAAAAGRWADAATAYREALARRETASLTDRLQTALRRSAAGERPRLTRGLTPDSGPPATAAMRPW